uniref:Large subunit ribosomal protein LP2 n=1 Tax=Rhipicephalus zambeziensis TaxID=60191 RepID=A0A224YGQ1_9ACAR
MKMACFSVATLVEQAETHVVILLGLFLLFLFLGCFLWSCCTTTTTSGRRSGRRSSSCTTTRGHSSQLFLALRDDFVDGLSLQLADDLVESLAVGFDADAAEDLLDVGGRWVLVAAHGGQEVSGDVTHF